MLRALYLVIIAVCILPTIPGLLGVVVSALGYVPPIGLHHFSFDGFNAVFDWEGFGHPSGLLSTPPFSVATWLASSRLQFYRRLGAASFGEKLK